LPARLDQDQRNAGRRFRRAAHIAVVDFASAQAFQQLPPVHILPDATNHSGGVGLRQATDCASLIRAFATGQCHEMAARKRFAALWRPRDLHDEIEIKAADDDDVCHTLQRFSLSQPASSD
jgi:hypothetical protein